MCPPTRPCPPSAESKQAPTRPDAPRPRLPSAPLDPTLLRWLHPPPTFPSRSCPKRWTRLCSARCRRCSWRPTSERPCGRPCFAPRPGLGGQPWVASPVWGLEPSCGCLPAAPALPAPRPRASPASSACLSVDHRRRLLKSPDCDLLFSAYCECPCGSGAFCCSPAVPPGLAASLEGRAPAWHPVTAAGDRDRPRRDSMPCLRLQRRSSGSAASGGWARARAACCGPCTTCASEWGARAGAHHPPHGAAECGPVQPFCRGPWRCRCRRLATAPLPRSN